jgi:hypothetical protein
MYRKPFLPFGVWPQICAVCLLFTAVLNAQDASGNGLESQGPYKLSGTVVNAVTGEPIRRALVEMSISPPSAVLTDAEGKFEFDGVPQGRLHLNVHKPGFFNEDEIKAEPGTTNRGWRGTSTSDVRVGPDMDAVTLKLIPEGIIAGRIDANGEPLESIPVKIFMLGVREGGRYWVQSNESTTDADGLFRVANLQPGTYYVMAGGAWNDVAQLRPNAKEQGFGEIFYNNAEDLNGAAPIEISPGQQAEINFSLKPISMFRVSGTVSGPQVQNANLSFVGPSGVVSQFPTHFAAENGQFETMVPSGAYTLEAKSYNTDGDTLSASLPIRVNSNVSGIQLPLMPAISIPIDVREEDVAPHQGGSSSSTPVDSSPERHIRNTPGGGMMIFHLRSKAMSLQNEEVTSALQIGPGTAQNQVANIEPGRYQAWFPLNAQWYIQSAQCGGVDLLRDDLIISAGSQPPPIEIVVRNDPASLTGSVSADGSPAEGDVLIIPDGAPTHAQAANTRGGHFEIDGLAPGDYSVVALPNTWNLEYTNPEVIAPYLASAQHVSLQGSQKSEVNLELAKVEKQ